MIVNSRSSASLRQRARIHYVRCRDNSVECSSGEDSWLARIRTTDANCKNHSRLVRSYFERYCR